MRLKTWIVAAVGLASLRCADRAVDAGVVAQGAGDLCPARPAQHASPQRRGQAACAAIRRQSVRHLRPRLPARCRARTAPEYREQLATFRQTNMATLAELRKLVNRDDEIASLQTKLEEYWEALDPLFDWTPAEKIVKSAGFLRRDVVPRRDAVLTIAQEIEELNNANLAEQRAEVAQSHAALRRDLDRLRWQTVLLGLGGGADRRPASALPRAPIGAR